MVDEHGPRLAATTERRRAGRSDRRAVAIPTDWPAARDTIEAEFHETWIAIRDMGDDVHAIRELLEAMKARMDRVAWKQGIMWAVGLTLAGGLVSGGFFLMTRHLDRALTSAVSDGRVERVEAIADILPDIPRTPALRLQTGSRRGSPTVSAVQDRLPSVRGIRARERDAACVMVPDACAPP